MSSTSDQDWDDGPGLAEIAIRYWWLLLALGLLGAAGLFLYTNAQQPLYAATARLLLQEPEVESVFGEPSDDHFRYVQNQVKRLESREVAAGAAELVGEGYTADAILQSIELSVEVDNDLVTITAYSPDPQQAAAIANAVGQAYQDSVRTQVRGNAEEAIARLETTAEEVRAELRGLQAQLEDDPGNASLEIQRDALVAQLSDLSARQDQIAIDASLYGSGVELFEEAVPPAGPVPRGRVRMGALGLLLGAAMGMAIAWFHANRDDRADRRQDPAAVLQAPLLGAVPDFRGLDIKGTLPTITDPRSPAAEAYQFVVASLRNQLVGDGDGARVVLVTSPQPGDGKTVTAVNLAVAASRDERDVLLVDADARVAGLSRMIGFSDGPGLHELQQDPDNLVWSPSRRDMPEVPSLEVVPVGSDIDDPAGFFRTAGFVHAVRRIRDYADFVVIDTPPLLAVSDTAAAAELVDGIILVIAQGTPLEVLEETRERLQLIKAPLLGYIFNRADARSAPYAYRYDRYTSHSRTGSAVSVKATASTLQS